MFWKCSSFEFDVRLPLVMGILNMTPDSFSDGGNFLKPNEALTHAFKMLEEGARIIDVGGESTRPGASPVTPEEEWARIATVVETLAREGVCVSVDTRHAEVAAKAVAAGASIVNDVSGFRDPAMRALAAAGDFGCVVMHMPGTPQTMADQAQYTDVVNEVRDYLAQAAAALEVEGVDRSRICVDPGPGFGKTPKQTIELVRNFQEFRHLGYPVMAALSRKSYIGYAYHIDDPLARDEASAQEALMAAELGATVIRTHNVAATMEALKGLRPYVVLGLGANVALVADPGEEDEGKIAQINHAIQQLCLLPDSQIIDIAPFYGSEAAYYNDQPNFVNTVALLRTGLPPKELLPCLHAIENSLGRVREIENGPRTLDLDIVDYQMYVVDTSELTLPHPRAVERDFVVKPLQDILPGHVLADGTAIDGVSEAERLGRAWRLERGGN
ncbi:MAG: dihydropteroate synthase [Eggerthellaceae bacterium]|nr:dihydropteroate synthase [Eggerthellaceae bacterium]